MASNKVRQVLSDPEFFALKPSAQLEVLGAIDPEFSRLLLSDRLEIIRLARDRLASARQQPDPIAAANVELGRLGAVDIRVEAPKLPRAEEVIRPIPKTLAEVPSYPAIPMPPGATPEQEVRAKESWAEKLARLRPKGGRHPGVKERGGVDYTRALPPDVVYVGEGQYAPLPRYLRSGEVDPGAVELAKTGGAFATSAYNALIPTTLEAAGGLLSTLAYYSPTEDMADVLHEVGNAFQKTAEGAKIPIPDDLKSRLVKDPVDDPSALLDPLWWSHGLGNVLGTMIPIMVPSLAASRLAGGVAALMGGKPYTQTVMSAIYGTGAASFIETLFDAGLQYREAIEYGAKPETAAAVAVETVRREFPVTAAFNLAGLFNPAIKGGIKRAIAGFLGEGLQEASQGVAQRSAMEDVAGIDQEVWKPTVQEFLLGAIGGAAFGPAVEAAAGRFLGAHKEATESGPPTITGMRRFGVSEAGRARERIWSALGEETATHPLKVLELRRAAEAADTAKDTAADSEWDLRGPVAEAIELRRRYREEVLRRREGGEPTITEDEFLLAFGSKAGKKAKVLFSLFGEPISKVRARFADYLRAKSLAQSGLQEIKGADEAFISAFSKDFEAIKPTARHKRLAEKTFGVKWDDLTNAQQRDIDRMVRQRLATLESKRAASKKVPEPQPTPQSDTTAPEKAEPAEVGAAEGVPVAAEELMRQPSRAPEYGSDVEIRVPGEATAYKARYSVRELADVVASHNPFTFEPNPDYRYVNERNYSSKVNAQRVAERSTESNFDPSYLLTESPTGEHGPPIIDPEGNVLGGNARTMILSRVYAAKGAAAGRYRSMLAEVAEKFGISAEALAKFDQPVLVREVSGADPERVIRDTNKASVATLSRSEQAIADAKRMTPKVIELLKAKLERAGPDATVAEALRGVHGRDVVEALIEAGVLSRQEVPEILEPDQTLNEIGRMRISGMLVGRLFEDARDMDALPKPILRKLERVAIPVMASEGNPEWDIRPDVQAAARLLVEANPSSTARLEDWLSQTTLTGESGRERYGERAIQIARKLLEGQRAVLRAFRGYAEAFQAATGPQDSFFMPPDSQSAFSLAFSPEPELEGDDVFLPGNTAPPLSMPGSTGGYKVTSDIERAARNADFVWDDSRKVLFVNQDAMLLLSDYYYGGSFRPGTIPAGLAYRRSALEHLQRVLQPLIRSYPRVGALLRVATEKAQRGALAVVVNENPNLTRDVARAIAEERAHVEQLNLEDKFGSEIDADEILGSPEGQKALKAMQAEYGNVIHIIGNHGILLEVTVRLMRGHNGWSELGLSAKEALSLTARYLNALIKTYGNGASAAVRYTIRGVLAHRRAIVNAYSYRLGSPVIGEKIAAAVARNAGWLGEFFVGLAGRIRSGREHAEEAARLLDEIEDNLRRRKTSSALGLFSRLVDEMGAMPAEVSVAGYLPQPKVGISNVGTKSKATTGGPGGRGRSGPAGRSRGAGRRGKSAPALIPADQPIGGEPSTRIPEDRRGPVEATGRLPADTGRPGASISGESIGDARARGTHSPLASVGPGGWYQRLQSGGGRDLGLGGRIVDRYDFTRRVLESGAMMFGRLDPLLQKHLYPYQQAGVIQMARVMHAYGGALLADGPGTGKTAQIMGLAKEFSKRGKKVIIVSIAEAFRFKSVRGKLQPTGSYAEWAEKLELSDVIDIHSNKDPKVPQAGRVVLATYNAIVARPLDVDSNTVLVFDEAHALKNAYDSRRGSVGISMARGAGMVLYSTATPYDRPQEIIYLERLQPFGDGVPMREGLRDQIGLTKVKTQYGEEWRPVRGLSWAHVKKNTHELWKDLFLSGRVLRRELRMDGVTIYNEWMDLPVEAKRVLDDIEANFPAVHAKMHQRRQIEPYKIPRTIELVKQELGAGRSVIVFVARVNWSQAAIRWSDKRGEEHVMVVAASAGTAPSLKAALIQSGVPEDKIAELHGGAETQVIKDSVERFRSNQAHVILATIEMGGTGLNLDDTTGDRPRTIIVTTAPFSALQVVQAVGRGWRATTKSDLKVVYLRADHPVDEWGVSKAIEKMKTLGAVVHGPVSRLAPGQDAVSPAEEAESRRLAEKMLQFLARRRGGELPPSPALQAKRRAMVGDVARVPHQAEFEMESWQDWLEHFHPDAARDPVSAMFTRADLRQEYHRMMSEYSRSMLESANYGLQWWAPYPSPGEAIEAIRGQREAIERDAKANAPLLARRRGAGRFGRLLVLSPVRFLSSDVVPTLKEASEALKQTAQDFLATWAPSQLTKGGKVGAMAMRYRMAEQARRMDQLTAALESARRVFDKMSKDEVTDFISRMEEGVLQPTRELESIASQFRGVLDRTRDEVRGLGTGKLELYYVNYFPHIWKDRRKAEEVAAQFFGRRPLEGPKSFLKKRTHIYFREGLEAGLEPVSWNPVDLVLMKISEMGRYIMAHRFLDDMKENGLVRFVPHDGRPPAGWRKIIDPIGTVYGRPFLKVSEYPNLGLYSALSAVARALGVHHTRGQKEPKGLRKAVGAAYLSERRIATKSGSAEQVIAHEIGHMIDFLGIKGSGVGMRDLLLDYPGGQQGRSLTQAIRDLRSRDPATRKSAREYLKLNEKLHEKRKQIAEELRELADERHGVPEKYRRSASEKMAAVVEAWVGARELFRRVAPTTFEVWASWLRSVPELAPLANIEGTLDLTGRHEEVPIDGLVIKGWWYAPRSIATMLENHLQVGLRRYAGFRLAMALNNAMNMFQLSLSGFHLVNTTLDAMATQFSLAAYRLAHGQPVQAAAEFVKGPVAPILNVMTGDRLYKAWHSTAPLSPDMAWLVDLMLRAGGRAHMSDLYRTRFKERMLRAFSQGNLLGGLLRLPVAFIESVSDITMEYVVPRMKLGAFAATVAAKMSTLPASASRVEIAAAVSEAWDVVEDRLGEVVYDNYFWNRFAKDIAHLMVRSVGWNLGTFRVFFSGVKDTLKLPLDLARLKKPELTLAAAYAVAVVPLTALVGALIMRLLTGRWPEELEDYFFPQTGDIDEYGRPRRVSLPTYFKDFFHISHEPLKTIANKASPLVDLMADMLSNRDFYGVKIRNEDDPIVKQLVQALDRVMEQFQPFGVREAIRAHEEQAWARHMFLPFLGMVPAPSVLGRTEAERKAQEYIVNRSPRGGRTEEQATRTRGVRALSRSIRLGLEAGPVTKEAIAGGHMTPEDIRRAIKESGLTPLEVAFQMLSLEEGLQVWRVATREERVRLAPHLARKMSSIQRMPPAQADRIIKLAQEVVQ